LKPGKAAFKLTKDHHRIRLFRDGSSMHAGSRTHRGIIKQITRGTCPQDEICVRKGVGYGCGSGSVGPVHRPAYVTGQQQVIGGGPSQVADLVEAATTRTAEPLLIALWIDVQEV